MNPPGLSRQACSTVKRPFAASSCKTAARSSICLTLRKGCSSLKCTPRFQNQNILSRHSTHAPGLWELPPKRSQLRGQCKALPWRPLSTPRALLPQKIKQSSSWHPQNTKSLLHPHPLQGSPWSRKNLNFMRQPFNPPHPSCSSWLPHWDQLGGVPKPTDKLKVRS